MWEEISITCSQYDSVDIITNKGVADTKYQTKLKKDIYLVFLDC